MKNYIRLTIVTALFSIVCIANPLNAQTVQTPADTLKPFPDEVLTVLKKSCFNCHTDPGRIGPLEKLNLSKWNGYTAEKQVEKANAICEVVTKGDMPPGKFKEKNPDAVPTADDLKILCDWVKAMQADK
jgi:hypothetical protein